MLCELAYSFPPRIAELLERDRGLTRNFREETVTDFIMMSLVGLEAYGIQVDFPDKPTTGGDMDWIYAAPLEINGGRYLRLVLQARYYVAATPNSPFQPARCTRVQERPFFGSGRMLYQAGAAMPRKPRRTRHLSSPGLCGDQEPQGREACGLPVAQNCICSGLL